MQNIEQYKTNRLHNQIEYYENKASKNQRNFYIFSVADLILTSFIPLFSLADCKYITAILGALAAISTGLLLLFKNKELWTKYRSICETLKVLEIRFDNRLGEYFELNDDDAERLFMEQCEQVMSEEHSSWKKLYSK